MGDDKKEEGIPAGDAREADTLNLGFQLLKVSVGRGVRGIVLILVMEDGVMAHAASVPVNRRELIVGRLQRVQHELLFDAEDVDAEDAAGYLLRRLGIEQSDG